LISLGIDNVDAEKLRLEGIIRTGIAPPIAGLAIKDLRLDGTKIAMVIRLPVNFGRPHVVTFNAADAFIPGTLLGNTSSTFLS
jgi:hypothetical protein